jgi:hypothetical protein
MGGEAGSSTRKPNFGRAGPAGICLGTGTFALHFLQVRNSAETYSDTEIGLPQALQIMMMSAMGRYYYSFFDLRKSMLSGIMHGS